MEGLTGAFMFAVVTILARISWDLFCVRESLGKGERAKKKHPGHIRRGPEGESAHELDGSPRG